MKLYSRVSASALFLSASLCAATGAQAQAQASAASLDLAAYGGALNRQTASPVPISPRQFLVAARGLDGSAGTADDLTLLITVNGTDSFRVDTLATPYLSTGGSNFSVRVSSTLAVIQSRGADGNWESADDALHILRGLGTMNSVTTFPLPGQRSGRAGRPVPLGSDSVILSTIGADEDDTTADDELIVVRALSGIPSSQSIATPYLFDDGTSAPVLMSADSLVVTNAGADELEGTADDGVHYVTNLFGTPAVTNVSVPYIYSLNPGTPVPVTTTSFLVSSVGPDESEETDDDELVLVEGLGGAVSNTEFSVPNILDYGGGRSAVLSPTLAVVSTQGADGSERDADDSVWVLSDIGGANTLQEVIIGGLDEDAQARCQRIGATQCALTTGGADFTGPSLDDEVVVISDIGGTNALTRIVVPGLEERIISRVTVVNADTLMVASGGADGDAGTGDDDVISVITGVMSGAPEVTEIPSIGSFDSSSTARAHVPTLFPGSSIVAFISAGPDGSLGTADDLFRVISLPDTRPVPVGGLWTSLMLIASLLTLGLGFLRRRR
ncbi:hypothetical protein EY643_02690 [Halioglobus maricola]|uniref:IPTL-CTERM sorting domain-containing protein n=1 Tax=Halioglobus maricola TaxID=2601894 RepID=A0A5P9NFS6_9GAMM|nr:hypothetical protein [Halioglobus maricola]QFU74647.1 hypothetical protein EY643_02690 [Halioglobus maricola]